MRPTMPSFRDIEELPTLVSQQIPPEWQDLNGHVNVQYYIHLYDLAGYPVLEAFGVDADFVRVRRRGWFELEHHVWYLREIHVGDTVTLHCRLLQRSRKRFHGVMFVANRTRLELSSVMEFISTAADLDARTSAAIPDDVAAQIDLQIDRDQRYRWAPPTSGTMAA